MLQDHSEPAVEVRNHGKLESPVKAGQDLVYFRIRIPDPGFGEVAVDRFEIGIAIELVEAGHNLVENAVHQLAPPAFVVVRPRPNDGRTTRHSLPAVGKGAIERAGVEPKSNSIGNER